MVRPQYGDVRGLCGRRKEREPRFGRCGLGRIRVRWGPGANGRVAFGGFRSRARRAARLAKCPHCWQSSERLGCNIVLRLLASQSRSLQTQGLGLVRADDCDCIDELELVGKFGGGVGWVVKCYDEAGQVCAQDGSGVVVLILADDAQYAVGWALTVGRRRGSGLGWD